MKSEFYITGFCLIESGNIRQNEEMVFSFGGQINDFLLSAYQHFQLNYPKFYKMDNLSKLGWLAAEILLDGVTLENLYRPEEIAIILANANSSLDDDLKYLETVNDIASPSLFVYTLPNIVMGEISIRHHLKGEQAFFIQENFDAGFIYQQVNYLLKQNKAQACICGWVDVIGEAYKAALFFVETEIFADAVLFSASNMEAMFNQE